MERKVSEKDLSRVDLWALCRDRVRFDALESQLRFDRLPEQAEVETFEISNLSVIGTLSKEGESTVQIRGTMRTVLSCAHCGGPVDEVLVITRNLVLMPSEQAAESYDEDRLGELDDVVCCDGPVDLSLWVEDELLLSLPMLPRHSECAQEVEAAGDLNEAENQDKNLQKPFAMLDQLIKSGKH